MLPTPSPTIGDPKAFKAQDPPNEQGNPYVPAGPEPLLFEKFNGINTTTSRPGVKDEEMAWCSGFMPLGPARLLRTLYGVGTPIYTTPTGKTLAFFDFFNIGTTPYMVDFLSDGSIVVVNTATTVATTLAGAGTITNPSRQTVDITQYGSTYLIIVAKQTNGYFIWDGTTFYSPGGPGPTGTMPTGIGGDAVEIYSGRVWIANGPAVVFSAPGSVVDFSSNDGGGSFVSSDSFLRYGYTQLIQTNGFLYLIGDSSINYISGVQTTAGTPPVTTFTNQNADPEVGTPWPGTCDVWGRNIVFANSFGAHISYGAAVTKISEPLDGVFNTVPNFGSLIPSAGKAIIFGKKVWILLLPIIDPITGQQTNTLFMWNGKIWWSSIQDVSLIYIQHQEINSVLTCWGTNGTTVYPLFQNPTANFTKVVQSKLWDTPGGYQLEKAAVRLFGLAIYYSLLSPNLTVSIDNESGQSPLTLPIGPGILTWTNNSGQPITWTNSLLQVITWFSAGNGIVVFPPQAVGQVGVLTGLTFETNCPDMALISAMLQDEIVGYRG